MKQKDAVIILAILVLTVVAVALSGCYTKLPRPKTLKQQECPTCLVGGECTCDDNGECFCYIKE